MSTYSGSPVLQPYFEPVRDGEQLDPMAPAASSWRPDMMRGPAISGALARAVECLQGDRGRNDLRVARWTLDMNAPTWMSPCDVSARVVQESARLLLVEARLANAGRASARATALFLKPTENPDVRIWAQGDKWDAPPPGLAPLEADPWLYRSAATAWSSVPGDSQDSFRKCVWFSPRPIVAGEAVSPFQALASFADLATLVTNWGDTGVSHINTDITMSVARLPEGLDVGMVALQRVEHDGIAIGSASMFDRDGTIGMVTVSALANSRRRIDLSGTAPRQTGAG